MPSENDKKIDGVVAEFTHPRYYLYSVNEDGDRPKSYLCRRKFPCFGDVRIYTTSLTLLAVAYGMYWGYFLSILTSIERRYHLSSSMSGFLLSSPEIGRLSALLFISHFGNRVNIPRLLAIGFTLVSIGVFCQTIPHYAITPDSVTSSLFNATDSWAAGLCFENFSANDELPVIHGDSTSATTATCAIFVATFIMMGAAASPFFNIGLAYIENNSERTKTSRYIGLVNGGFAFGLMFGLFLGSWCTTMYVEVGETSLTPADPAWVGRWWLGLLMIGSAELLTSLVLYCFPKKIGEDTTDDEHNFKHAYLAKIREQSQPSAIRESDEATEPLATHKDTHNVAPKESETYGFKGLFRALFRLFKNPVFISLIASYWCTNMFFGFIAFLPKYVELQLSLQASHANLFAAIINGVGYGSSLILSGNLVTWCKLKVRGIYLMLLAATLIFSIACVVSMFLGCDTVSILGMSDTGGRELNMTHACNVECGCDTTAYSPVCDDGQTYFSPCHAGCIDKNITHGHQHGVYLGCACTRSGTVTPGSCPSDCSMTVALGIFMIVAFLMFGTIFANVSLLIMRIVDSSDKALALGVTTMGNAILGWMQGPLMYGAVIDSACRVWEVIGPGQTGSCWVYDLPVMRLKIMGMTAGWLVGSFMLLSVSYILIRKQQK